MNTDMPIFAEHHSSIGNAKAGTMASLIYILVFLVSLAPYAEFIAWIIPLFFLYKEKDSELVKFCAAQCLTLYFFTAFAHLLITFIPTVFSKPSSCVVIAFMNIAKDPFWSILYILISLITAILTFVCVKYAKSYSTYRLKFFCKFADRLM